MAHLKLRYTIPLLLATLASAQTPSIRLSPIRLNVDATDAPRRLLRATMQFPVKPGPMSLLYPEWIPGEHGPTGPIVDLAGVHMRANGQTVAWRRDDVNMFEFHVDIPPNVSTLDVSIEFISPPETEGFSAGGSITSQLALLSWNQLLLYPKGPPADEIEYQADLKIPDGWKFGTALPIDHQSGNEITFQPAPLDMLIDSPVQTGINFRTIDLSRGGPIPTFLHIAADSEHATHISDDDVTHYRNLIEEANALFGAHHYRGYHFLLTLSDHVAHFGLEHHESSDDRTDEDMLTDYSVRKLEADLLPHEYVHSWNGKFRMPAGLATPDYSEPMKGELLWVYEGLTQYLGEVLSPRSGLWTPEDFFGSLARDAAALDHEAGRTWRPLEDTAVAAQLLYDAREDYSDLRRSTDFYEEGALIWLDVDVTLRTLSKGKRSLDDFCKAFAGPPSTGPVVKPYTFDDVVRTLNSVQPYDWAAFLNERLQSTAPHAPLNGILNGGYSLVYTPEESDFWRTRENVRRIINLSYSLGFTVHDNGDIIDVHLNTPAFKAGLTPDTRIVAINGRQFSGLLLHQAVRDSPRTTGPIALLIKDGEYYRTINVDYHDGELYPHLERNKSKPDLISEIIRPRVTSSKRGAGGSK